MTDVFLYSVPSDAAQNDVRLRDPTVAAGGAAEHTLEPASFANVSEFGVPAFNATLAPAGFANASEFGVPSVNATLAPAGFANTSAFGVPALNATLAPAGFANVSAFGRPTVQVDHTLRPAGFANVTLFGRPILAVPRAEIGGRLPRRRRIEPKPVKRLHEDILREQREAERYLAELENKKQVAPAVVPKADEPEVAVPVAAQLPDALARAVSAQQVIERARASSAEALARAKAEEKRRVALLLLALD